MRVMLSVPIPRSDFLKMLDKHDREMKIRAYKSDSGTRYRGNFFKICYICNQKGHVAKYCPERKEDLSAQKEAPQKSDSQKLSSVKCLKCGKLGTTQISDRHSQKALLRRMQ